MSPKAFTIVAMIAAATVIAAAVAVGRSTPSEPLDRVGQPVFPGLIDRVNEVTTIIVESSGGTVTVQRGPQDWTVKESDGYPADARKIQKTVLALAELSFLEPKTRRPDRYATLEVNDPGVAKTSARRIRLLDGRGNPMAEAILGKSKPFLPGSSSGGIYLRLPDEKQSWLAKGEPEVGAEPKDWLRRTITDIAAERIRRVVLRHPDGDRIIVVRKKHENGDFVVENLPRGKVLRYDSDADGLAAILDDFDLDDVRKANRIDFVPGKTTVVDFLTSDGLVLRLDVVARNGGSWARLAVEADKDAAEKAVKEARELAARTDGWVYRIPEYLAARLKRRMADLVKDAPVKSR